MLNRFSTLSARIGTRPNGVAGRAGGNAGTVGWIKDEGRRTKDESTNNITRTKVDSLRLIHPTLISKKKSLGFCLFKNPT